MTERKPIVKTDDIFTESFRDRYRMDGFSEEEIDQIQKDTVYFRKQYAMRDIEQRYITSRSYENSLNRTTKTVEIFLGVQ
jgi:hypothetical protein